MKSDSLLEFRVLTGTHAGARALLAANIQRIGSGDSCDLILTDEGVLPAHATVIARADGRIALRWEDESAPQLLLQPGQSAWLGPVRVAIDTCDAPWRDDLPIVGPPATGEISTENKPATANQPTLAWIRLAAAWYWAKRLALAAACAVGLTLLGWPLAHSVRAPDASVSAAIAVAEAPPENLGQLIRRLGLQGRVSIDHSNPERLSVRASFLTGPETETLTYELARRSPAVRLSIVDEAQAINQVVQSIKALGTQEGIRLTAHYLGGGRFRIEGGVNDQAQHARIASDLNDTLTQVTGLELNIQIQTETALGMVQELKRQGIPLQKAQWADGVLQLAVTLPAEKQSSWEAALLAAASQYEIPFRAIFEPREGLSKQKVPPLPFAVRSIMSNPVPYVVLSDGRRLVPGGIIEGWQLLAVEPQYVKFEGPQGYQFTLER